MSGNKYYWLKLKRDWFKRHDVRILEGMPNGHEMVLFYLKLLCESVDHDGELRFSDKIPYDTDMLASVTNTDIEIVKKALEILEKLDMIAYKKDKTIVMLDIGSMLGSETAWAAKKRQQRDNGGTQEGQPEDGRGTEEGLTEDLEGTLEGLLGDVEGTFSDKRIEKEKEKEKDSRDRERKKEEETRAVPARRSSQATRFVKPSVEEVKQYCTERQNGVDPQAFWDFYEAKGWRVGNQTMKDWKACVRTWEARQKKEQKAHKPQDIPYMQKEYDFSEAAISKKEQESLDFLGILLDE